MTKKWLFAPRRASLLGWCPRPPHLPIGVVPVVAAIAAVLLSASTAQLEASAPQAPRPVAITAQGQPAEPPFAPPRFGRGPAGNIEALAAVLAHKYRISLDATRELVDAAYREGGRTGLDPLLIVAVIGVESRFNPIAQSDTGAMGLMQVIPRYHGDKFDAAGGESVLDPLTNIHIGARVLEEYIRRGGTETAGLQLYNGSLDDESNAYAHRVLGEKQRLEQAIRRGS